MGQAEVIYSLFKDVIETHSKNPEHFYSKFYGIVGDITDFGNLSKNAIIILGFELANQVMCFIKKSRDSTSLNSNVGNSNTNINLGCQIDGGGLWYTNNNAIEIFMKTENVFKIETSECTLLCIDSNKIVIRKM